MDAFEGKPAEQVRLYKHLYDPSMRDHRGQPIDFEFMERDRHHAGKI